MHLEDAEDADVKVLTYRNMDLISADNVSEK
jgi:hypothetical protein